MDINEFINLPQFTLDKVKKESIMLEHLTSLHHHHFVHCEEYKEIANTYFENKTNFTKTEDLPFLPVSIFKNYSIKSITDENVYKIITSSGTTGSIPSRIYLDRETAQLQSLSLSKIINHVLGTKRLPMLIADSKEVLKNKDSFSARGAGILGLSVFGRDHTYLLNENYEVDEDVFNDFLKKYNGQPIFIFGFTFMVWQYLFNAKRPDIDLSQAILIHSGGWKKLIELQVDNDTFKRKFKEKFGLEKIYNFYGMVEQVGSVFLENNKGFLHCPNFADIIIRNPADFSVQPHGKEGLIQVISVLPKSYPGFSLLTEDIGVCMGEDDVETGRMGKYFKIIGRSKKAELRGCSDTFK